MNRTARVLAALLATVVVGVAIYAAYQSGFDRGAVTAAASGQSGVGDNSETGVVVVPGAGFGGAYRWHGGFGFFPLFPILFFLLIFGFFRAGRWGGGPERRWGGGGPWGPPKEFIDERMTEWHKQAHNQDDANHPGG